MAAVALSAAGAATSAVSASNAASAESDAQKFNAQVADNNATVARDKAKYEAARLKERNRRIASEQRGEYLASGLQLNGSVEDVLYDSSLQGELDVLSTAYSGKIQSNAQQADATLSRKRASSARSGVGLTVLGTALGAGSQITGSVATYNARKLPKNGQG